MIDKIRQTILDSHRISMTFRLQMFVKVFEYVNQETYFHAFFMSLVFAVIGF